MTVQDLFSQILNMSLTASVVIVAVLAARLLLRRAPKVFSYALWAVVLFRLLCPISFEAPFGVTQTEVVGEDYSLAGESVSLAGAAEAAYQAVGDAANGGLGIQHVRTTEVDETTGNDRVVSANWFEVWVLVGGYVWLGGILVMLVRAVVQGIRLRRRLIGAVPLEGNVRLADHIDTPFVLGLFRPKIYLPSSLSEAEREYILLHERHHIRRGDHVMRVLAFAALCLHWFNPLVWAAFVLSGKDMEMSCDEAVMRKMDGDIRADYSESLLRLATGKRAIVGTPLAFGEGDTKSRVKNVMKYKKPMMWVIVAAAVVLVAVVTVLAANQSKREQTTVVTGAIYLYDNMVQGHPPNFVFAPTDMNAERYDQELCITADMRIYLRRYMESGTEKTLFEGKLEPYDMSLKMEQLIDADVTDAWILRQDSGDFYLVMRTKSGDTLFAEGWEDIAEANDVYSDDTEVSYVMKLKSILGGDNLPFSFFSQSLVSSVVVDGGYVNVFQITEMPGYAVCGFLSDADTDVTEDMSGMGYAVFKAYDGKKGYRLMDWHVYEGAAQTEGGIYMADHPAVLDDHGKQTDKNTYDVILSTNKELGKIERHGDNPNKGVIALIDSCPSMTVFNWSHTKNDQNVYTVFYDKAGDEMVVDLPERMRVIKILENYNADQVRLDEKSMRTLLTEMTNAPWVGISHPVYDGGTTFVDGFVIRVEYEVHDEYVLHDDMVDCFVWEYGGEYFLSNFREPEDGMFIQKVSEKFYLTLADLFEPFPYQMTVTKYVDEQNVGSVVVTDIGTLVTWHQELELPDVIITLAYGATAHRYEDGYVIRFEYAAQETNNVERYVYHYWGDYYFSWAAGDDVETMRTMQNKDRFEQLGALFETTP